MVKGAATKKIQDTSLQIGYNSEKKSDNWNFSQS